MNFREAASEKGIGGDLGQFMPNSQNDDLNIDSQINAIERNNIQTLGGIKTNNSLTQQNIRLQKEISQSLKTLNSFLEQSRSSFKSYGNMSSYGRPTPPKGPSAGASPNVSSSTLASDSASSLNTSLSAINKYMKSMTSASPTYTQTSGIGYGGSQLFHQPTATGGDIGGMFGSMLKKPIFAGLAAAALAANAAGASRATLSNTKNAHTSTNGLIPKAGPAGQALDAAVNVLQQFSPSNVSENSDSSVSSGSADFTSNVLKEIQERFGSSGDMPITQTPQSPSQTSLTTPAAQNIEQLAKNLGLPTGYNWPPGLLTEASSDPTLQFVLQNSGEAVIKSFINRYNTEHPNQPTSSQAPPTTPAAQTTNTIQPNQMPAEIRDPFKRDRFREELKDPKVLKRLQALTLSEVGYKDKETQMGLIETLMNRVNAHPGTYSSLMDAMGSGNSSYYAPFHSGGKFNQNYNKLMGDPALQAQMDKIVEQVLAGSNYSNFGTQNSSGSVAASAARSQTITGTGKVYNSKETWSRKDRSEYSNIHGAGIVREEQAWLEKTKKAYAAYQKWIAENGEVSSTITSPTQQSQQIPSTKKTQPVLSLFEQTKKTGVTETSQKVVGTKFYPYGKPGGAQLNVDKFGRITPITGALSYITPKGNVQGITSGAFDIRRTATGGTRKHYGVDMYAIDPVTNRLLIGQNAPIFAPVNGKIIQASSSVSPKAGKVIKIKGKDGIVYRFLHTGGPIINPNTGKPYKVGDDVTQGDQISTVTGSGTYFGRAAQKRYGEYLDAFERSFGKEKLTTEKKQEIYQRALDDTVKFLDENGWGEITAPHLHFETKEYGGGLLDPASVFDFIKDLERGYTKAKSTLFSAFQAEDMVDMKLQEPAVATTGKGSPNFAMVVQIAPGTGKRAKTQEQIEELIQTNIKKSGKDFTKVFILPHFSEKEAKMYINAAKAKGVDFVVLGREGHKMSKDFMEFLESNDVKKENIVTFKAEGLNNKGQRDTTHMGLRGQGYAQGSVVEPSRVFQELIDKGIIPEGAKKIIAQGASVAGQLRDAAKALGFEIVEGKGSKGLVENPSVSAIIKILNEKYENGEISENTHKELVSVTLGKPLELPSKIEEEPLEQINYELFNPPDISGTDGLVEEPEKQPEEQQSTDNS